MLFNSFQKAKQYGRIGEEKVASFLEENGYVVTNLSGNKDYFQTGDLLATKNGKEVYVEVKTDSIADKTGNLVVELLTNVELKKDGWFKFSKADVFMFYLENSNELISIKADELRKAAKYATTRILYTEQYENGIYYKQGQIGLLSIELLSNENSFRRFQL